MKTTLLLVGKTTNKHITACIDDYVGRICHYMPFTIQVIPELKGTKSLSMSQQKEREGELILKKLQESDHVILLDEKGIEMRSVEWAEWLDQVYTKFNYQATVIAFGGKLEPSEVLSRYYSSYKRNFTRYNNPFFDETFDKAEHETDQFKRVKYYKYCQELLTKSAPAVFIADPNNTVLLRKDLHGYEVYPVQFYNFAKMYFD